MADESPASVRQILLCYQHNGWSLAALWHDLSTHVPVQVVSLAEDLLKGLPQVARSTLVFGSIEAALLASSRLQNQVVALEDAPDEPLTGPLLITSPSVEQVGLDPLLLL